MSLSSRSCHGGCRKIADLSTLMQEQLRDSPLVDLQQPVLFLRGTRDSFCEEKQFRATLKRMTSAKVDVRPCLLLTHWQY